jgi:septal ring factor EnvC (AmiA/AmiB activator)
LHCSSTTASNGSSPPLHNADDAAAKEALEAEALALVQQEIGNLTARLASRQLYKSKLQADVNALLQEQKELTSSIVAIKSKHGDVVDPVLRKMKFFEVSHFG